METHKLDAVPYYRDIREAFGQSGCPFCRLLSRSADRYLDAVLWEMVNDTAVRDELNQARGYCQQHSWMLVRAGAALGVAILTRDVIKTLLGVLESSPVGEVRGRVLQSLRRSRDKGAVSGATAPLVAELLPQVPCPVCAHSLSLEQDYAKTLLAHLDDPGALAQVYRRSDGLCLPHFRQTLAQATSSTDARTLVATQQAVWEQLHAELSEFIRKKDYRYRDEPFGDEKDAWRRALESVAGPPPRSESERRGLTQSGR
jgi:hypothetical protein